MVHKVVCKQPPRKSCKIGAHKSLLAAHRSNGKKFLRQRTKSGRATKLHFQKAGYEWKDSSNRWVKKKVECDKSTRTGRLNNRNGKC
jgi:hypothetical protein